MNLQDMKVGQVITARTKYKVEWYTGSGTEFDHTEAGNEISAIGNALHSEMKRQGKFHFDNQVFHPQQVAIVNGLMIASYKAKDGKVKVKTGE